MTVRFSLPRRVTMYYLLFSVVSIAWLASGSVAVSQAILRSRTEGACLTRLGKAASAINIDYLRQGDSAFQKHVERLRSEGGFLYCAIVAPEGRTLAHSTREHIGTAAQEPVGERIQWGDIISVRFTDPRGSVVREYRAPLQVGHQYLGTLRIGQPEAGLWHMMVLAASYAPFALLAPLACVATGALILARMVSPLSEIELQLRRAALAPTCDETMLHPVRVRCGAGWGWNRLIQHWQEDRRVTSVEPPLPATPASRPQRDAAAILQSLSEGVAATDDDFSITYANPALPALLGDAEPPESVVGASIGELLGVTEEDASGHALLDPTLVHRTVTAEIRRSGPLGDRVLRVARYPLQSETSGAGKGFVWSVRDVTQQKLAEKMRDQFLDSATHELRTPLTNIRAYAETLALNEVIDVEQQKEFCNIINSEAIRLSRFVDELLCISSLEAGSMAIKKQNVELERLLNEAAANVRPLMDQKRLEFEVSLPPKMPEVKLDKDKFSAALVNLLGNAAKYTPEGGRVRLKARYDDARLMLDVEDSGVGIAAEELPKIFDKFFRSADRRVRQQTGTGLGLSFANEIVRLHGGAITVKSELDKGSTFTLTVPLA